MAAGVPGLSDARLKEVSAFVGYSIDQFTPGKLPGDLLLKGPIYVITVATIVWPFFAKYLGLSEATFAALGLLSFVANLIAGFALIFAINGIYNEWKNAVAGIGSGSGQEACRNVHSVIMALRRLINWDNALGYETMPFTILYLGILGLGFAEVARIADAPMVFGDLAPAALLYYAVLNLVRSTIIYIITARFTFPDKLDPSLQICAALAFIHKQFQNCSTKVN